MASRVCVNSVACVRVKGGERECFRINSGVRQRCIMSLWSLALQCIYGCSEEGENRDGEEGSEILGGGKRVEITWPLVFR